MKKLLLILALFIFCTSAQVVAINFRTHKPSLVKINKKKIRHNQRKFAERQRQNRSFQYYIQSSKL